MIRSIFKCFEPKDKVPHEQINETPKMPETKKKLRILFLPGHQPGGGAQTYLPNLQEDEWCRRVLERVETSYSGRHELIRGCKWRFERSYSEYVKRVSKFCKENSVDLCIELHLNAAAIPEARGCEALIISNDESAYYAHIIASLYSIRHKTVTRGRFKTYRGVKALSKKARGANFLYSVEKAGTKAIIWEPFFCDYATYESEQFLSAENQGVNKMADFWLEALKAL